MCLHSYFFIKTIPQKEYTKVVSFSTFLEDLLWSMYLHLKLQKFGIYHGVELRLCVEKVGLKERFLLQILGWYQKMQKNRKIRDESVKWDRKSNKIYMMEPILCKSHADG